MNRKDYVAIAQAIRESDKDTFPITNPNSYSLDKETLIERLCIMFWLDNPLFDEDKFRKACNK